MGNERVDPGWSVNFRARKSGRSSAEGHGSEAELEPLTLIQAWRFPWAYLIPPMAALLWLIVLAAVFVMKRSGIAQPTMWLAPTVMVAVGAVCPLVGSAVWSWPQASEGPERLKSRYVSRLKFGVFVSPLPLMIGLFGAIVSIDGDRAWLALADFALWCLVSLWMAPTVRRVRHDVDSARRDGLDLPGVIFEPIPRT